MPAGDAAKGVDSMASDAARSLSRSRSSMKTMRVARSRELGRNERRIPGNRHVRDHR